MYPLRKLEPSFATIIYHHESWTHLRTCFSRQDQPAWWNCSPEKNSWETADDDVRFPVHGRQKFPGRILSALRAVVRSFLPRKQWSPAFHRWLFQSCQCQLEELALHPTSREKRPGVPSPKLLQECTSCKASPSEKSLWDRLCGDHIWDHATKSTVGPPRPNEPRWQFGKYL